MAGDRSTSGEAQEEQQTDAGLHDRVLDACVELLPEADGELLPAVIVEYAQVPAEWFGAHFGTTAAVFAALGHRNMTTLLAEITDRLTDPGLTCWQDGLDAIYRVFASHRDDPAMTHIHLPTEEMTERLLPLLVTRFRPAHRSQLHQPLSLAVECWGHLMPRAGDPVTKRLVDELLRLLYMHMNKVIIGKEVSLGCGQLGEDLPEALLVHMRQ